MKTVRDVMTTNVISVSPSNKIKTAIILMKGHNIGGLPVVDGDQVVGILDYQDILGKDNDILVQNVMDREFVTIPPDLSAADAADLMAKIGSGRLLVMDNGRLAGIVTRADLIPELGKSFDPITGLPRADAMRDWGIAALRSGSEISVIFIDLDQFGQFNKKYGHITGDRVLQHVANVLRSAVDDERDMLCRYAGDEFVIVTTRHSREAQEFANLLMEKLRTTPNPDLPEPVTGSAGVHGGKRTKEREQVHYEATLDNLINLASKSCTLAKTQASPVAYTNGDGAVTPPVEQSPAPEQPAPVTLPVPQPVASSGITKRLAIHTLNMSWTGGSNATAEVSLANGQDVRKCAKSGFALGNNALRLVAEAAAGAVNEFLPQGGYGVLAESVNVFDGPEGQGIVLVTALIMTPQNQTRVCGSSIVKQDAYRASAAALLDAVNRQISALIESGFAMDSTPPVNGADVS